MRGNAQPDPPTVVVIGGPNGVGKTTTAYALLPVSLGGHEVPEDVIRRRYGRSLVNFVEIYQPLADSWILCDNSGSFGVVVARGERDTVVEVRDEELYDEIRRATRRERARQLAD